MDVQQKVDMINDKLDRKAKKRISLMKMGFETQKNAYPCIFIKKKTAL